MVARDAPDHDQGHKAEVAGRGAGDAQWLGVQGGAFTALADIAAQKNVNLDLLSSALDVPGLHLRSYMEVCALPADATRLDAAVGQLVRIMGVSTAECLRGLSSTVYGPQLSKEQEALLRRTHKPAAAAIWCACLHSNSAGRQAAGQLRAVPLSFADMQSVVLAFQSPKKRVLMEIASVAISGTSATANMLPNIALSLGIRRGDVRYLGLCVLLFGDSERLFDEGDEGLLAWENTAGRLARRARVKRMWRTMMMLPGGHEERANRLVTEVQKENKRLSSKEVKVHPVDDEKDVEAAMTTRKLPQLEKPPSDIKLQKVIMAVFPNHEHQKAVLALAALAAGRPTPQALDDLAHLLDLDPERIGLLVDLTTGEFLRILGFTWVEGHEGGDALASSDSSAARGDSPEGISNKPPTRSKDRQAGPSSRISTAWKERGRPRREGSAGSAKLDLRTVQDSFSSLPVASLKPFFSASRMKLLGKITGLSSSAILAHAQQVRQWCEWSSTRTTFVHHAADAMRVSSRCMNALLQACGAIPTAAEGKGRLSEVRAECMLAAVGETLQEATFSHFSQANARRKSLVTVTALATQASTAKTRAVQPLRPEAPKTSMRATGEPVAESSPALDSERTAVSPAALQSPALAARMPLLQSATLASRGRLLAEDVHRSSAELRSPELLAVRDLPAVPSAQKVADEDGNSRNAGEPMVEGRDEVQSMERRDAVRMQHALAAVKGLHAVNIKAALSSVLLRVVKSTPSLSDEETGLQSKMRQGLADSADLLGNQLRRTTWKKTRTLKTERLEDLLLKDMVARDREMLGEMLHRGQWVSTASAVRSHETYAFFGLFLEACAAQQSALEAAQNAASAGSQRALEDTGFQISPVIWGSVREVCATLQTHKVIPVLQSMESGDKISQTITRLMEAAFVAKLGDVKLLHEVFTPLVGLLNSSVEVDVRTRFLVALAVGAVPGDSWSMQKVGARTGPRGAIRACAGSPDESRQGGCCSKAQKDPLAGYTRARPRGQGLWGKASEARPLGQGLRGKASGARPPGQGLRGKASGARPPGQGLWGKASGARPPGRIVNGCSRQDQV
ncbi:hypothetical protein CYMTET_34776 [Cymbomonas tetramitiformis]|uniref:Uncharacterized protein n=1 Tax=Cymbomonas tetramitiformis TaxID=36881 RepID=A0AAE0KPV6_9CHLO|nr:hypothetical protein CYMTET_34776 [Cymbomonas tetramitiformis]